MELRMKERRQFERFQLELSARIEPIALGKKQVYELKTRDISSSGAFLYTPEPFPEGTRLKMDLTVLSEKIKKLTGLNSLIECEGTIVRVTPIGVAVCFDKECRISSLKDFNEAGNIIVKRFYEREEAGQYDAKNRNP